MANRRIYYAVQAAGFSICGANSFTMLHGLQSIGINTKFNLEQVFEIGQQAIYANIENVPDCECTLEKVIDGYPPLYLQATKGSVTATIGGRSNIRTTVGLSIFSDVQDSASGTPLTQATMSGMYLSALNYNFQVQGNSTESVTLVGNNKTWSNTFTSTAFNNDDAPLAITGSGGVQRRQDIIFGASSPTVPTKSLLPKDIPGVTSSGTLELDSAGNYGAAIQSIKVSANLGREALYELGKRGPYHRYVQFPVEVKTDIEVITFQGDAFVADEESSTNTTDQKIWILMREGLRIDLGTKNRCLQITYGGANAGQNGGNATCTFSYQNFNDLIVQHPQDPTTALRP